MVLLDVAAIQVQLVNGLFTLIYLLIYIKNLYLFSIFIILQIYTYLSHSLAPKILWQTIALMAYGGRVQQCEGESSWPSSIIYHRVGLQGMKVWRILCSDYSLRLGYHSNQNKQNISTLFALTLSLLLRWAVKSF